MTESLRRGPSKNRKSLRPPIYIIWICTQNEISIQGTNKKKKLILGIVFLRVLKCGCNLLIRTVPGARGTVRPTRSLLESSCIVKVWGKLILLPSERYTREEQRGPLPPRALKVGGKAERFRRGLAQNGASSRPPIYKSGFTPRMKFQYREQRRK